jgi:hypothetical protein
MGLPSGMQQTILTPATTLVEGTPVPAKLQAVQCAMGTTPTLFWTFVDQIGNAIDFTDLYNLGYTPQVRIREVLSMDSSFNPGTIINCMVTNPPPASPCSTVTALVPASATSLPGISFAEWALLSPAGVPAFTNLSYFVVNPGQFAANVTPLGMPSLAEIRLALRDSDPAGNLWLGTFEWDTAEIAWAIGRPIMEFNEEPPPIDQQYTTVNFPWRHNWLKAISGYLMRTSADWYRRVHLPYEAGGLAIDDKNKFKEYDARGQELLAEWTRFVRWKKVQLNTDAAYQTLGSFYGVNSVY